MGFLLRIVFAVAVVLAASVAVGSVRGDDCPRERLAQPAAPHDHAAFGQRLETAADQLGATRCLHAAHGGDCCHASAACGETSLNLRDAAFAPLAPSLSASRWTLDHPADASLIHGEAPTPPPRPVEA